MKYLIAFDTICQGWQTGSGDDGEPVWYDNELDAYREILDDSLSRFSNNDFEEEDYYPSDHIIAKANQLSFNGTTEEIKQFLSDNPDFNYYDLFVVSEDDWIEGRKTIFILS